MTFIVFVSGALFVGIFFFLMRNRIPAEKVLASCVDSHREASIYAINMILIVLDTLAYRLKVQSSIKITIQLIQLLLIVGNLVTLKRKRLFWNETFNEFYAGGLSVGYVIQIIYALIVWKTLPTAIFSLLLFFRYTGCKNCIEPHPAKGCFCQCFRLSLILSPKERQLWLWRTRGFPPEICRLQRIRCERHSSDSWVRSLNYHRHMGHPRFKNT
eukprot:GABU01009103.1.p1 GENE.GABU01009103.1~~GABU01009103.1.p1  ORF type:complete len:214 (-),score=14.78 GABU01009103.1:63-704(-)